MMQLECDVALDSMNTFGLKARASHVIRLDDDAALDSAWQTWRDEPELLRLPWRVLGGGSNLILPAQLRALVLKVELAGRQVLDEDADSVLVRLGGGENWHEAVQWSIAQGWSGIENLSLIPGTVGAAPVQNIGAYGVEVEECLNAVHVLHLASGRRQKLSRAACRFSYRDSIFKQELAGQVLITAVELRLSKVFKPRIGYGDITRQLAACGVPQGRETPADVAAAVIAIRRSKLPDPAQIGNAGSFFKNPLVSAEAAAALLAQYPQLPQYPQAQGGVKLAAGWLIEQAGWKGRRLGPAGMYEKQALCLVNHGGADAADILAVRDAVQAAVQAQFGVALEPEPVQW